MLLQCSLHVSEPPLDGCPPTRIWVWLDFGNIRLFLEKNIYVISEKWNDMFLSQNTDALQVFSLLLVLTLQHINKEDRRKAAASFCPSLFLFIFRGSPSNIRPTLHIARYKTCLKNLLLTEIHLHLLYCAKRHLFRRGKPKIDTTVFFTMTRSGTQLKLCFLLYLIIPW